MVRRLQFYTPEKENVLERYEGGSGMKQQETRRSGEYDVPIPKPPDELFQRFLRSTEAKFVTKRFTAQRDTNRNRGVHKRSEAR